MKKVLYLCFSILVLFISLNIVKADPATTDTYAKVMCGNLQMPALVPTIFSTVITIIQMLVPVILIVMGSIDLAKAVMAGKEDDIKKNQSTFFTRLVIGVVVFLIVAIVKLFIGIVAPDNTDNESMWNCVDCLINNECS